MSFDQNQMMYFLIYRLAFQKETLRDLIKKPRKVLPGNPEYELSNYSM